MSFLEFPAPPPTADEVHLWAVRLAPADPARVAALAATLDADERARADRFLAEAPRRRFIVTRGTLRTLLGAYLEIEPARIVLETGPRGKPALAHTAATAPFRFNLAHADDLGVIAVASGRDVGVDIEPRARRVEPLAIADRYFAPEEAAALHALPPDAARVEFLRLWVCKEAIAKALGLGIAGCDLARLRIELPPDAPPRPHPDAPPAPDGSWTLRLLGLEPDHLAALAVSGGEFRLRVGDVPAA